MAEVTRSAKVAVFALALTGAGLGMYAFVGKTQLGSKGVRVHTFFHDATGLAPLSRVTMAGIPIGQIKSVTLTPDGRARIDIDINKGTTLHKDAAIGKQTATLLSEPFLGMTPGSENVPLIADGDEITHVIEPVGTDQILQDVGQIAQNVKKVSESLADTLASEEGHKELKQILANVEQATAALNQIARENQQSIHTTITNLEAITTEARPRAKEILDNVDRTTTRLDQMVAENRDDIRGITKGAHDTVDKVNRAGDSLESALGHVDSITGRIDRGEGTIGRLTKDDALIDEVQGAAEGVNDFVGGLTRLQTIVGLRSDYNFLANAFKNYVEVRLQPREDKYYSFEIVNDPRGLTKIQQTDVDTTNPNEPSHYRQIVTTTENSFRFSLQFARRLNLYSSRIGLTGRFGIKESTGGIGLDTALFDNRFEIQQDLFGFGEQLVPRWRVTLFYEFIRRLWLQGGIDNILSPDRRDYFVGLTLRFNDEDLKSVLLVAPKTP